ncbi:MAG: hypothetical protein AAFN93_27040, partial [Bacteroidota bacterium]
ESFSLQDIESKLGNLLGTTAKGVVIHDFAVNPISQNIYMAVSRSDANQLGFWKLPNDVAYANILLKLKPDGSMEEVSLANISHSVTALPSVIEEGKQNFRKSDLRTEAITDIEYYEGKLYVAGLSNEEFASSLQVLPFPFNEESAKVNTIEVWHVAHGKSETQSPIRSFMPYTLAGEKQLLAVYTCTPLVSISLNSLQGSSHVKGKTLAEMGAGNMPIDIISYVREGKEYILVSNASKALLRIDPDNIAKQKELTGKLESGAYTAGVKYDALSRVGIMHIDNLNENNVLVLQRTPGGMLNFRSYSTKWL